MSSSFYYIWLSGHYVLLCILVLFTSPLVAVARGDGDRPIVGDVVFGFATLDGFWTMIVSTTATVHGLLSSQILVLSSAMTRTAPNRTRHHHDIALPPTGVIISIAQGVDSIPHLL